MEYNNNTYIKMSKANFDSLGMVKSIRTNNDNTNVIFEFGVDELISQPVIDNAILVMTHQEAITEVGNVEWNIEI